jgi:chromosome segregation ATPase
MTATTAPTTEHPAVNVLGRMNVEAERLAIEAKRAEKVAADAGETINRLVAEQAHDDHDLTQAERAIQALRDQMAERDQRLSALRGEHATAEREHKRLLEESDATITIIGWTRDRLDAEQNDAEQNGQNGADQSDQNDQNVGGTLTDMPTVQR